MLLIAFGWMGIAVWRTSVTNSCDAGKGSRSYVGVRLQGPVGQISREKIESALEVDGTVHGTTRACVATELESSTKSILCGSTLVIILTKYAMHYCLNFLIG